MKQTLLTISMFFIGIFFPGPVIYAGVVKSSGQLENNYDIQQNIIIYDLLSSYQIPGGNQIRFRQKYIGANSNNTFNLPVFNRDGFGQISSSNPGQQVLYSSTKMVLDGMMIPQRQGSDFIETSVGTFLDSFKDDPTLRTIYFTSKDLKFSYNNKIRNGLQLEFDMEAMNFEKLRKQRLENSRENFRPLTKLEKQNLRLETGYLFGLIAESYKSIILISIGLLGFLFLFFRFFLNKYI